MAFDITNETLVGEKLVVDTEKMRDKADQLSKLIQQLNAQVDNLKTAMDSCEQGWEGQAAEEYQRRFNDTYSALKETVNKFKDFTVVIYQQAYEFDKRNKTAADSAEYVQMMVERLSADMFRSS